MLLEFFLSISIAQAAQSHIQHFVGPGGVIATEKTGVATKGVYAWHLLILQSGSAISHEELKPEDVTLEKIDDALKFVLGAHMIPSLADIESDSSGEITAKLIPLTPRPANESFDLKELETSLDLHFVTIGDIEFAIPPEDMRYLLRKHEKSLLQKCHDALLGSH